MNAYNRRSYSGTAPDTSLATGIDNAALTVTLADATGWPDGTNGPFEVTFEPDTSSEEKDWASSRSGNTVTLLGRGMEGAALAHAASTTVRHGLSAKDVDEANYAVSQTVGQIAAKGDLLVGSAANTLTRVAKGSAGQVPVWQADGSIAAGKPTLAESDITGLVNDLAAKLGAPATAFAKGSVLAGTGTNTFDTTAVGTDGTVLTADSTASGGVSWQTPTSGLLAHADYATALAVSQSSVAALDTNNASVTFTAPASGNVILRASVEISNGTGLASSLILEWFTHGTTTQVGRTNHTPAVAAQGVGSASVAQVLASLTAGNSYHLDLAARNSPAIGLQITALTLEVWAV